MNTVYLAVCSNGHEYISNSMPIKTSSGDFKYYRNQDDSVLLPMGTIEKLLGRKITYEESPVKVEFYSYSDGSLIIRPEH